MCGVGRLGALLIEGVLGALAGVLKLCHGAGVSLVTCSVQYFDSQMKLIFCPPHPFLSRAEWGCSDPENSMKA